jgi:hypothetical protein
MLMNLSIGLQVFSIRKELAKDFWGTLEQVAEIGYENIEFANHRSQLKKFKAIIE